MRDDQEQLTRTVTVVREGLSDALVGIYLFGSAVIGGLKPRSDLDMMVVATRRTTDEERRELIGHLLDLSGKPRHLEVTIVVESDIKPWRYPARMDFQYGDWWRSEFETGDLEPWEEINPDLATLVEMVLIADHPLQGPPPAALFDPVPRQDLVAATLDGMDDLLGDLDGDAPNVVLTLARMWSSLAAHGIMPKDDAAEWALARLPGKHQGVLAEARAIYIGEKEQESDDFVARARRYADDVAAQIREDSRPQDA